MENLPSAQLQKMKKQLRGKIEMYMTKIKLTNLAITEAEKTKKGITALQQYVKGMPALLFTKENPFSLYKILKKSKSSASAKAGQIAPRDIIVPAGPTPFAPGPVISEFAALGIKAGVEGGKVAVKQDTTACKEGKPITAPLASMLARLGIEPMEIGLNLVAVFENGVIYTKKVLDIDEEVFAQQLMQAASQAYCLAMETAYTTKETIELLLQKTFRQSKAITSEAHITANTQEKPQKSAAESMIDEIKKHETQEKIQKPSAEQLVKEVQETAQAEKTKTSQKEISNVEALMKKLTKTGTLR